MVEIKQDCIIYAQKDFPLTCVPRISGNALTSLWHESLEIKLVTAGSVTMMIDTETITALAGDIIFINPYEVHSNLLLDEKQGSYFLFMLDLDYFGAVGSELLDLRSLLLEKRIRFRNLIRNPQASTILRKIAEEYTRSLPYYRVAVTGLLQELFAILLRQEISQKEPPLFFDDRVRFYKSVEPAVIALRDRYAQHFSGDTLAALCGINRHHFCRVFKRAMGMTPVQYQNECRLRIADILLKIDTMSISEIARAVVFSDEAYFSRTYKKSRGISPLASKSKLSK